MAWLGIIATGACGLSFFVASEWAAGLKEGKLLSKAALGAAVLFFLVCIGGLVCFPPAAGLQRNVAVAVSGVSALACFWFMKSQIDHFQGQASIVSGTLGLTLFATGFIVFFGKMPEHPAVLTRPPNRYMLARLIQAIIEDQGDIA